MDFTFCFLDVRAEAAEGEAAEALSVVRVAVGEGKHRMVHLR